VELDGTLDMGAFSSGAGALSGAGTVDNSTGAATYTLTVGGNGDPGSFSGIIQNSSGSVALTKTGTGTETLSGANTYAGNTIINAGTLQLGVANAIPVGSSVTVATNAILDLNNFSPTIAALSVSGLPPSPAGQVINYSGTLTVNGNAAAALNGQNYNGYSCISASINGPSLTKSGTHAMAFRGNNSSFGPITFSGGTLSVGAAANLLPTSMALSVPTGALFQLDANNQTIGDLSGSGGVNLGGGILTVTPGDTATFSGVIQNSELAGSSTALGNGLREYSYTNIDMTGLNGVTDNAQVNVNWGPPSGPTLACNGTSTGYGASVTPSGSLTGTYTVECWACPSNTAANISMIGTRTPINTFGFDMKFDAGGNLIHGDIGTDTAWITTTADSTFAFTANTWCHVAYVVTPTGYTIYANGNQIGTGTYASTTPILYDASHPNIYIGQYGNGEYFNGRLSDVRIWNTARTATQIQTNMNQRLVGTETGLVGYWRCDDGSGTTLTATVGVNGTLAASTGWAASNPAAVTSYYHSARWLGQVLTTVAGTYTFTTTTGDGARLWVNGTPVIDGWVSQGATARSGTLTGLAANTRYDLVMECFNGAAASLSWMPPGDSVPVIIPSANLYLPGPGSLVMNGGGTQVLSGANTYSGGTTVSAGTLEASVSGALGSGNVTVAGGANLKLDASTAINSAADLIISAGSSSVNLAYTGTRNIHAISLDGGVTYAATGHYGASANNASGTFVGTGLLNVTASPTSNALTATTNSVVTSSAVYGTPVVLTSTITGSGPTRTGTVTFWDGANWLGSAALNGSGIATLSVSNLLVTSSPHSLTAVYGGDSNYATSTSSAVSVSTTPASITAIPVVANKTYDGTTTATITSCTFGGILASDTNYVHISGTYTANFSPDGSVGVNKTVNISGLSLLGSLAGNYNLTTTASSTASITNRVLTLSGLTTPAKIYDSTTNETVSGTAVLVVTNVVSGETVTLTTGTEVVAFLTKYVANNKPVVIVSGFTLNGTTAANYVLALTNLANITTFPISVSGLTVNGKPYDGTTTATLNGTAVLAPSAFAGDNVILGGTPVVNFTNANAGLRGVTVTGYVISGNDATNYALSQPIGLAATISLAATTTAIASSVNPSVVTSNVTFTLTVACATTTKPPTGTATFYTNGTPLVPTVTLVSNTPTSATAVFSTVGLPIGTTPVEAQYGGDANFTAPLNAVSTNQIVQSGSTCSLTNRILSVTANGGNSFTLNLIGTPQAQYYILAQTNVAQPMTNWLVVTGSTNTVTNVSGLWSITVTNHAPAFYRSRAMNSCQ
jgi:autotransporter-associated beta strand protein